MSMAKFDTVETPENHEVKPPEVIEDTESIKSGDGESGIDSEIENFAKMGEDETSNETSNETKESPEDSEVKNSYAEGMSEADKESYGISSEIEDFVKTGQMDDVKLPSEMQEEGEMVKEFENKLSDNIESESLSDEKVDDSPTIFQKASAVAGMFLASLGANYDSTSDVLDALNKEQPTEIHEILEDEKDLGQKSADEFGENLVDAVGGIAEAFQNKEDIEVVNLPPPEGSDGSEGEGGGDAVEMNTSFEQDGPTLQETWNTDVDNVAYDQNDDE